MVTMDDWSDGNCANDEVCGVCCAGAGVLVGAF